MSQSVCRRPHVPGGGKVYGSTEDAPPDLSATDLSASQSINSAPKALRRAAAG